MAGRQCHGATNLDRFAPEFKDYPITTGHAAPHSLKQALPERTCPPWARGRHSRNGQSACSSSAGRLPGRTTLRMAKLDWMRWTPGRRDSESL